MDIGLQFYEWFMSMNTFQQIVFVVGFYVTLKIGCLIRKGIDWIFYPHKKSIVGKKHFWL
ncbi:hypothetical protein BK126_26465 [Paenibacillus sp. FSL H7-0326]|nr:hypothetical protein BK126_26465 [Paenibacillus sp. FSL H7-0326]